MSRRIRCSVCGLLHEQDNIRRTVSGRYICTDCLENNGDQYCECPHCHEVYESHPTFGLTQSNDFDMARVDGERVCWDCYHVRYIKCRQCNHYHLKSEMTITAEGDIVCPECLEEHYHFCDECNQYHLLRNIRTLQDTGRKVCWNCVCRIGWQCSHCNQHFSRDARSVTYQGYRHLCNHCMENHYTTCDRCGNPVARSQVMFYEDDEGDDYQYCNNCYRLVNNGEEVILGYHGHSTFEKKRVLEDKLDETLYFGFELEVSGNRSYAKKFLNNFISNDVVLMNDSSIRNGGFEIVTMPMTLKYFNKVFRPNLVEGLRFLIDKDFKGHNHGGMHIHVSEEVFDKLQIAQLRNVLYGSNNDIKTWTIITQRKPADLHWCKLTGADSFNNIKNSRIDKPNVSSDRYTALNHSCRTRTYEFRIFNSSLRIERILKNIECVLALIDYTDMYKKEEEPVCDTTGFIDYVIKRRVFYPNLFNFLKERELVLQHSTGEYIDYDQAIA